MANIDKIKVGSTTYSILDSATAQIVCDNEESGNTASKTYQKGEFLKINGKLYKTTAIVASGGTLTEGVNITETHIGDEISSINSALSYIKLDRTITEDFNFHHGETFVNGKSLYVYLINNSQASYTNAPPNFSGGGIMVDFCPIPYSGFRLLYDTGTSKFYVLVQWYGYWGNWIALN